MLQAKAQVVITAIPSQRVVHIEFSIEIPDSILKDFPDFIVQYKGINYENSWNSHEYGFKVFHNRAWDNLHITLEIRSFLQSKEITDIVTQIEGDEVKHTIVRSNYFSD